MKRLLLFLMMSLGLCAHSQPQPVDQGCDITKYRPISDKNYAFAYGEFLYWKPTQNAVDYALVGQPSSFTAEQQTLPAFRGFGQYGTIHSPSYDWDAGFRIGLGGLFQPRNWEIEGNFTYIHPDGSDSASKPANTMLIATHPFNSGNAFLARAKSSIDISYSLVNLLLMKRVVFSEDMIVRFFMGATGTWIDNNWRWKYFAQDNVVNAFSSDWNFSGGGVRGGIKGEWYFCYGLGLSGLMSTALMYGHYDNQYRMKITPGNSTSSFFKDKSKFCDHRILPHFQLALGPQWGMVIQKVAIKLYVQYELNILFNLHEVHRSLQEGSFIDGRNSRYAYGNVGFQGINVGASLAF